MRELLLAKLRVTRESSRPIRHYRSTKIANKSVRRVRPRSARMLGARWSLRCPPPCLLLISGHRGGTFELPLFVLAAAPRAPARRPRTEYATRIINSCYLTLPCIGDIDLSSMILVGRKCNGIVNYKYSHTRGVCGAPWNKRRRLWSCTFCNKNLRSCFVDGFIRGYIKSKVSITVW